MPDTNTCPSSALRRPSRISTVVVLPAPFGPSRPKISRSFTRNDMPSTATRLPYRFRSPSTTMAWPWVSTSRFASSAWVIALMPETLSPGVLDLSGLRSQCLLENDDQLSRNEAKFAVDRQHASVVGAVVRVHAFDSTLVGMPGDHHLQGAGDAPPSVAAQHPGVAHFRIGVGPPDQV